MKAAAKRGLIFDKDGTLFDFNATWGPWTRGMLESEASGDAALLATLADVLGYDLQAEVFHPGSIVIAETVGTVANAMLPHLTNQTRDDLIDRMKAAASDVQQVAVAPLRPLFQALRDQGFVLGLVTNDAETPARVHLDRANVAELFDFIAGYDSGHGAKPDPGQLVAFCAATGCAPADCVMIGDSTHDLQAGRAAGMVTVGVLTGPAQMAELTPLADTVLPSIADLPAWLNAQQ